FPYTVAHEPSAFVRDAKHPADLKRRNSLLARNNQMRRHQPLVQRNMRALIKRADAHRELVAAIRAMKPTGTHRLAFEALDRFHLAAERANGAIWPARCLKEFAGFIFVREGWIGHVGHA